MNFSELTRLCESEIKVEEELFEYSNNIKIRRYFLSKTFNTINGWLYKYHNPYGPAITKWYENGQISYADWFLNGVEHRGGGLPSYTQYDKDGRPEWIEYKTNGRLHNITGPALQKFEPCHIRATEYWIHGREYTKEEFDSYVKGMNKDEIDMLGDLGQTFD